MKFNLRQICVTGSCCLMLAISAPALLAQSGNASPADKKFVKEAMQGGMAEVELGQLASQKGQSDDVKQFGEKMQQDHTKLNDQMKPIAQQIGVTPPDSVSPKDKALKTKLEGLSGDSFDKAYIKAMVKDHQKDLAEFQKESTSGTDSQVKDAASQGAQVIQEHLNMIKEIAGKHGASAGSKMAGAQ